MEKMGDEVKENRLIMNQSKSGSRPVRTLQIANQTHFYIFQLILEFFAIFAFQVVELFFGLHNHCSDFFLSHKMT